MSDAFDISRVQIARQVAHWSLAAARLRELDDLASPIAWDGLEQYLGIAIRQRLHESVERLLAKAAALKAELNTAHSVDRLEHVRRRLIEFRSDYLRTETTLDFYGDAVNTRTNPNIAAILRACDVLSEKSMTELLGQLGRATPPVITYLDKGLGASILKAGLRLWDGGTFSPAAAVKIVRHNLLRPTALIHEAGHQVAHIVGWNEELSAILDAGLSEAPRDIASLWASWASEIAADAFAFTHTGYAAVAALHDVLSGDERFVFRLQPGDPHPINFVRILLGAEMCRRFFDAGPWDALARAWTAAHPLENATPDVREIAYRSQALLPRIVELTMCAPVHTFGGRPLSGLIDPRRVAPAALAGLERRGGPSMYCSNYWIWTEGLRVLALSGYEAATMPERATEALGKLRDWMIRLGTMAHAA